MTNAERRTFDVELRSDRGRRTITGYAAVFNEESQDLGGFVEVIRPGAFRRAIREDDVRALFNHDANYVLGRTTSGTLELSEDDRGLRIEINPPDTQWARDLAVSIERGDVSQMSFAFGLSSGGDRWSDRAGTPPALRELLDLRLYDVSPVTYPAYEGTVVSTDARSVARNWSSPVVAMRRRLDEMEREIRRGENRDRFKTEMSAREAMEERRRRTAAARRRQEELDRELAAERGEQAARDRAHGEYLALTAYASANSPVR